MEHGDASQQSRPVKASGVLDRVIWRDEATGLSVLAVRMGGGRTSVVRGYTYANKHQRLHIEGHWVYNAKYRQEQIEASAIIATDPVTEKGAVSYLASGVVRGIGPKTAQRLVDYFGVDVFEILDEDPERIAEVPGIAGKTASRLAEAWRSRKAINEIMLFLASQGISQAYARRIFKAYGENAIAVISRNPYALCEDVRGIGFKTADAIAARLGVPKGSGQRLRAGILFALAEIQKSGHSGAPRAKFLADAARLLEVEQDAVVGVLDEMLAETPRRVVQHDGVIFSEWLARYEEEIAAFVRRQGEAPPIEVEGLEALIETAQQEAGITLTDLQRLAVHTAATHRVMVLTGGPGCGKTSTLAAMLSVFRAMKLSIALAAPTGKAAQRAKEATGLEASTLHRLLRLGSEADEPVQIEEDVLVIDEMSMVDIPLMRHVVHALDARTRLVLVGDSDQLPSVGPGSVLRDLILSGCVPVVRLDRVFRQAEGSLIITNAHAIRRGEAIRSGGTHSDCWIINEYNYPPIQRAILDGDAEGRAARVAQAVADAMQRLVLQRIPERLGVAPSDVWVLSPMNDGECGVRRMNERLREALNPTPAKSVSRYGQKFGVGDRVLQCRNNYGLGIFNGDTGEVLAIDDEEQVMTVAFDGGREVKIPFDDLDDVRLCYAMTIHKSQGSQMPAVIIPLVTQHYMMLQRNVLYTGMTRARRLVVLIGENRAMRMAISNNRAVDRVTRMRQIFQ